MDQLLYFLLMLGVGLLIPTAYAAKIGAPWVPTRSRAIRRVMKELAIDDSDVVVDLGAGDGKVVLAAAEHGAQAVGYELSPIMWVVAWLRTRGRSGVSLRLQNFYRQSLPPTTTVVFAFLVPETMPRLHRYLKAQQLPHVKAIVSYAFPFKEIPPLLTLREPNCAPVYVYDSKQL